MSGPIVIPASQVRSAQMASSAWGKPFWVWAGSERADPDPYCARGRWFVRDRKDSWIPMVAAAMVFPDGTITVAEGFVVEEGS